MAHPGRARIPGALLLCAALAFPALAQAAPEVPTDRLIVRLKGGAPALTKSAAERAGLATRLQERSGEVLRPLRVMGDGAQIMQLSRRLPAAEIRARFQGLGSDLDVIEIVPDRLFFPALVPNDTQYGFQWYLGASNGINAPAAWDITTGSPNLVIGIVDTGKLPHDELASRWVGGYDFVSLAPRENDTPAGRDADASDPGDWVTAAEAATGQPLQGCPTTDSRWHGTAMGGVIAATGNNASGIAGINWNSKLLPVRVVGKCGGYESDIADGIRWAVGVSVPGVPANANVADVLNVSLSASGTCSATLQSAINEAANAGVPVIVAGGNNSVDASGYSPGNCGNVITVAAVDRNGGKAGYTNFGSAVTLSAPGGKSPQHFTAGDTQDNQWILTTSNPGATSSTGNTTYNRNDFGTSIATAQVTGIASLVLSSNPTLAPQYVREILRNTARPFPTNTVAQGSQADCTGALCGGGIANAAQAIQAAGQWGQASPRIDARANHVLAVRSDGVVQAWGQNWEGQVGVPGADNYARPQVPSGLSGVVRVAAGAQHSLALIADGTVWSWGSNLDGRLGDGSTVQRLAPGLVPALRDVTSITAGDAHSLALGRDGSVWAWGRNSEGQLGDGTTANRSTPVQVTGLTGVVAVAAGALHSLALKSDGTVWAWGGNEVGQLGRGNTTLSATPVQVIGLSGVTAIATAGLHSLALKGDGTVWAWGTNDEYQLGDGTATGRTQPVQVVGLTGVVAIAASYEHSLAVRTGGTVWAWGRNFEGQLGLGTRAPQSTPVLVPGLDRIVAVGGGWWFSVGLRDDGTVWHWGEYDGVSSSVPWQVIGPDATTRLNLDRRASAFAAHFGAPVGVTQVSNGVVLAGIGPNSPIAITGGEYRIDEGAYSATPGSVSSGQRLVVRVISAANCGATTSASVTVGALVLQFSVTTTACNTTPFLVEFPTQGGVPPASVRTSEPVLIGGLGAPAPITVSGGEYSIGCTTSFTASPGSINNQQSVCVRQTASPNPNTSTTTVLRIGLLEVPFSVITAPPSGYSVTPGVVAGGIASLGIRSDGAVVIWGSEDNFRVEPPHVDGQISGVTGLSAGYYHFLALRQDGSVWSKGTNDAAQLGHGLPDGVIGTSWRRITSLPAIAAISAGSFHSVALAIDGTVWAWGRNYTGESGWPGFSQGVGPHPVAGLSGVVAVSAGGQHSLALRNDGTVWAWGWNSFGQLGNGATTDSYTPVQVAGLNGITAIAAGDSHSLALRADGSVWAWGENFYFQLGIGPGANRSTPAQVPGLPVVTTIAAGWAHSLARSSDGRLWSWGYNPYGQLGDGTTLGRSVPVVVQGLAGVRSIDADMHSIALLQDGSVWAWGLGELGRLGVGTTNSSDPIQVWGTEDGAERLNLALGVGVFASHFGARAGELHVSNDVTLAGIGPASPVSIVGGQYRVDGGSFTSTAGSVGPGQRIAIRLVSSPTCGAPVSATVTVGALALTFTVTTAACDTTPDPADFVTQANAPVGSTRTSNAIYVSGVEGATAISIAGGEYSIGCGATFSSGAGTILEGQYVCVRLVASLLPNTTTVAVLTIGRTEFPFAVITAAAQGFSATPRVSAGLFHALANRSDGLVFVWGPDHPSAFSLPSPSVFPVPNAALSGVVSTAAGNFHSLALRSDGTVWAWGAGQFGQLGDGSMIHRRGTAVRVTGLSGVTAIAAGANHSLALRSDGTVWAWGWNLYGQLGNRSTVDMAVPSQVQGLSGIVAIAGGEHHSLALKSDGSVWAWGGNYAGQLGDGTDQAHDLPVKLPGAAGASGIAAGADSSYALLANGTVLAWGRNTHGQLGDGSAVDRPSPAAVAGLSAIVAIAAGVEHAIALDSSGAVWTWGRNNFGQLGDGTLRTRATVAAVAGLTGIHAVAAGGGQSFAWKGDGLLFGWGGSEQFAGHPDLTQVLPTPTLGLESNGVFSLQSVDTFPAPFSLLPVFDSPLSTSQGSNRIVVSGLGMGVAASIAITGGTYSVNGGLFTSASGTVINGDSVVVTVLASANYSTTVSARVTIGGASGQSSTFHVRTRPDPAASRIVPAAAAGDSHTYMLAPNGSVFAAGYNGNGQLGNGTTLGLSAPRPVAGLTDATAVASGAYHGLALRSGGSVVAWGSNAAGQLGHDSTRNTEVYPVVVSALSSVAGISAGKYHSLAVKNDGAVWSWGLNAEGQVGDGSSVFSRPAPVHVTGVSGVTAIAAGGRHSLALLADGTVRAWGANDTGQLGDGSTTLRRTPVAVSGLSGVIAIAAGEAHSLALKSDGTVVAWGFNAFGQLGDGTTTTRLAPVAVTGLGSGVGLVAAGANHSLAVKSGGALYAWGNNSNSQLGSGDNTNKLVPQLLAAPTGVTSVSGGSRHSAAITNTRRLYVWGDNFFGQVGNRSGNYNPHSASLNVLRGDSVISTGATSSGSGVGTGSNSGSSVLEIDNQQTGFDFGQIGQNTSKSIGGKYKNASATQDVTGVGVSVTGSAFSLATTTCPASLTPDQECTFTIGFNPGSAQTYNGELVVQSSVVGSPERRSLFGTGVAPATAAIAFAASGADFTPQTVNTDSATASYVLTNTGTASLTVSGVTSTLADFSASHNCMSVAPNATCALAIVFRPSTTGTRTARLAVTSNATGSPHSVTVSGTGAPTSSGGPSPAVVSLVSHYYQSILQRAPDSGGLAFWAAEAARVQGLGANASEAFYALAAAFFESAEYKALNRDNNGFVTDLYTAFFQRAPDSAGLAFWLSNLSQGMPREVALVSFLFSSEFASFMQSRLGTGSSRAEVDMVMDFYRGLLSRLPDDSGFNFWVAKFRTAQCQGQAAVIAEVEAISSAFALSGEYAGRGRTNAQYVGDLYNAFLRRGGDLSGVLFWISALTRTTPPPINREQLRQEFKASPEFDARVKAVIAQGCIS